MLLLCLLFLAGIPANAFSQGGSLNVDIKAPETVPKNGDFFVVTVLTNVGKKDLTLHVSQCWRSALRWTSDTPALQVNSIACKKNRLIKLLLKPGETDRGEVPAHLVATTLQRASSRTVTFRLGFLASEGAPASAGELQQGESASGRTHTIWSNAQTVAVTSSR